MRKSKYLLALLASFGVVGVSGASGNIAFQHYPIDFSISGLYIACLGETVTFEFHADAAFHTFETPSGKFHWIENWKTTVMITGEDSQRTWYGGGVAPYQENAGPAVTTQYVSNYTAKPLTGDGPIIKLRDHFKITFNAGGELVVYRWDQEGVDPSEGWKCIGKK